MLALFAMFLASTAAAEPVRSEQAACEIANAHVAARLNLPRRRIGFCDIIPSSSSPSGFYILAVHSNRRCGGFCSTNLGWYAVHRASGRLFEWDLAEQRPRALKAARR